MKKILSFLRNGILSFCSFLLQTHGKRIVVLTTLFMQLTQLQNFNDVRMAQLNHDLDLVDSENALIFPSLLSKVVWGDGFPRDQIVTDADAARVIIALTPRWLRYNRKQMLEDVTKVIQNSGVVSGAQFA